MAKCVIDSETSHLNLTQSDLENMVSFLEENSEDEEVLVKFRSDRIKLSRKEDQEDFVVLKKSVTSCCHSQHYTREDSGIEIDPEELSSHISRVIKRIETIESRQRTRVWPICIFLSSGQLRVHFHIQEYSSSEEDSDGSVDLGIYDKQMKSHSTLFIFTGSLPSNLYSLDIDTIQYYGSENETTVEEEDREEARQREEFLAGREQRRRERREKEAGVAAALARGEMAYWSIDSDDDM